MRTRRSTASPGSSSHPLSPRVTCCCATAPASSEHPRPYPDPPSTRLASPSPSSSPLLLVLISLARHGSRRLVQRSAQDQGFRSGQAHGQPERHAPVRPPPLPRLVPLVPSSAQPSSLASQPLDPAGKPTRKRPRRQRRTRRRRRSTECASVLPPGSSHRARPLDVLLTLSLSDCSDAMPTSLFFSHNEALVPPYRVIVDTNFINLSLENRVDIVKSMMDVLYAKGAFQPLLSKPRERSDVDLAPAHAAIPCISDCVLAELEKLGHQYRLALRCVLPLPPLTGPQDSVLTMLLPRPRPSRFILARPRPRPPRPPPLSSPRPSQRRTRPSLRAPPLLAQGHLRRRLHRQPCDAAPVLHRRDVRQAAPPAVAQGPGCAGACSPSSLSRVGQLTVLRPQNEAAALCGSCWSP